MYKGSYVAKIRIDFHIDPEKEHNIMSLEEIKSILDDFEFDKVIRSVIAGELDPTGRSITVELIREKAELHEE